MKKIALIISVCVTAMACKKSTPSASGCFITEKSITGVYIITGIKYKSNSGEAETDIYALLEDCQKDDTYDLKSDGTVLIEEGKNDCGLPPLPGSPNSWSLIENNTVLLLNDNLKIISFNCSQLVVEEKNTFIDGDIKTITYEKL